MIKNDSQGPSCTCPSGDGSLVHPCPAHPAQTQPSPAPTLRAAIDVANDRFEVPVAKWGTDLVGKEERPEVVAYFDRNYPSTGDAFIWSNYEGSPYEPVMTVAQHDRIVGALRAKADQLREALEWRKENQAGQRELLRSVTAERDAALARVAELETALEPFAAVADAYDDSEDDDHEPYTDMGCDDSLRLTLGQHRAGRIALEGRTPQAQAQHSVPDGYRLIRLEHFAAIKAQLNPEQVDAYRGRNIYDEDKVYANWNACRSALDEIKDVFQQIDWDAENELAELLAAAPGNSVPQAWLDVQAERRRQVEAEGWTPEHDDGHSHGQMARAAACYALAGSSAPNDGTAALLVSLAWPWDEQWWKPSTARRDLVKACALALAEIERLDRAAATQGGPRDA
ncbi:hypothetical protein E4L81_12990 [Pseudomonas aeruginosa]|uniref:hypothetical protein n=2 Tax=Pseudomonas aeruginosa TaxID=287 RepID=UPI000BB92398|nr:hypothetical protein [Pseudomonas aeruginosa]MCT4513036.1 hypothetical protein [Pseudomonas aeruginosa]MCT4518418.1 hypothetical protein [Pseudomonas aeruginosa]MCT4539714.1 hypothetical protein [Pseudomonas aeruginosa]MDH4494695.1 hypothetical protein [Pseudomonas aeruginosa]MDH4524261.1 hypothetical protein [Pseudomonas aeruginosa]